MVPSKLFVSVAFELASRAACCVLARRARTRGGPAEIRAHREPAAGGKGFATVMTTLVGKLMAYRRHSTAETVLLLSRIPRPWLHAEDAYFIFHQDGRTFCQSFRSGVHGVEGI